MSSLTTTWCPSSSQLRLAFNCRKSPTAFIRVRFQNLDYRRNGFRIYSVAETGNSATNSNENRNKLNDNVINEKEKEPQGNSWTNSSKLGDSFAGWSGSEQSDDDSKSKQSIGGIVGAGIAGVLLVAGLTFAALSVGKKNTSRVKQEMEPLTTQQEISLISDDHDEISGEKEEEKNKGVNDEQEISNEEKTGKDNDSFSYIDSNEALETSLNDKTESGPTSNEEGDITSDEATNKQDLQNETAKDSTPGDDSFIASTTESKDDIDLVTENTESAFEQEKVDFVDDNVTKQETENSNVSSDSSPVEFITSNLSESSDLEPKTVREDEKEENISDSEQILDNLSEINNESDLKQEDVYSLVNEEEINVYNDSYVSELSFDSTKPGNFFTCAGVPAPSLVSAALQTNPGKILIPAIVDQAQGQALTALQVLKVIEANVQPGDLCTRREYARWLVSASSALSRSTISKVYPAMYIENITELAFDDITPQDPDFPSIQGLAEAGLISSKLSRRDMQSSSENEELEDQGPLYFSPESALSRQDLVSWKMAIERRQLPLVNRTTMEQLCGFIDIDKIHPDAWPALVADLAAGEQGIIALALGYTRLFQPDKPVTKAQAAITLATGEASDIVNEELARIEAESVAEKAVSAHSELVAQVEKDINASYENELLFEREKINAVEKLAEETKKELERLKAEREEENLALMKERAAVDSEMEVFSKLRREVEEQLQIILSNQVEISYEKERVNKLRKDAEIENQEITRLQYELEVERKALSMARNWAEDEAKRAREQAKVLEEARVKWENQGIKVVVSDDLREEEENAVGTWVKAKQEEFSVEGTVERAETLMEKLKRMGESVSGKAKDTVNMIIQKIVLLISDLKERVLKASEQAGEFKGAAFSKISGSLHEMGEYSYSAKEGIKRTVVDWKGGVEKFTQRFKT